ncbi:MAG: UPF0182 family protein [Clostridia bacterium]|nr:UPF0182 family protein [Clostridia bacterium]
MDKKTITRTIIALTIAFILAGLVFVAYLYSEYLELLEIGEKFVAVYKTNMTVTFISLFLTVVISFTVVYTNFLFVKGNASKIDTTVTMFGKTPVLICLCVIFTGVLSYLYVSDLAQAFLPFINSKWFGLGDPIFHQDVGYYVFQRPFYITIINALSFLSGGLIFVNCLSYFLIYAGHDIRKIKSIINEKGIVVHIVVTVILFFIVKILTYKFLADSIIFKQHQGLTGANYTDVSVWLKFYNVAPAVLLLSVILAIISVLRSKNKSAVLSVLIYPLVFVLVSFTAQIVDREQYELNEQYIGYNMEFTKSAYGLDGVVKEDVLCTDNLDGADITKNISTVSNIKINEDKNTLNYINEVQNVNKNYIFNDIDTVFYNLNGIPSVVSSSAREIDLSKINSTPLTYEEKTYKYTHGNGVVLCSDNSVNESGFPRLVVKDIPSFSSNDAPRVTEPRIYYGEYNNDYCVVGTSNGEFDETVSSGYNYNGNGGVLLNPVTRLIYAVKLGDIKLIMSDKFENYSKLLINRNLYDRLNEVAPFFTYDQDPYIVVDNEGRLKWVVDVYTTSEWYPYSQYTGSYNYIRNSAKAVIDAYGGTVDFYITDYSDPLILFYEKTYPSLFSGTPMPEDIKSHIKYPEFLFKIQYNLYKTYHTDSVYDFYNKKDIYANAKETSKDDVLTDVLPSYQYFGVNNQSPAFKLCLPYTKSNSESITGMFTAYAGQNNYGKLVYLNYIDNITGTTVAQNEMEADNSVIDKLRLAKGEVIRGNMVVAHINNNVLYIKPYFIKTGDKYNYGSLAFVSVLYNNTIVCETTLDECFEKLFGFKGDISKVEDSSAYDIIGNIISSYDLVKEYLGQSDWGNYGKALNELDYNIENLRSLYKNIEDFTHN